MRIAETGELNMSEGMNDMGCGMGSEREQITPGGPPITLTPKAVEMVRKAINDENMSGHGLRIAVAGGGCSGLQYVLDFCDAQRAGDTVFSVDGLTVYIDLASAHFLKGTEIDYLDGEEGSGFKFNNPNPMRSCCGCGG
jgi:iron-sulfur cluster assembly accessory protein